LESPESIRNRMEYAVMRAGDISFGMWVILD